MRRLVLPLLLCSVATAQPAAVRYQGFLADSSGTPVNAPVDLYFAVYDRPTGGVPIWTQDVLAANVTGGFFVVGLGIDPFDLTQNDLYLGLAVEDPGEELLPRQRIASAPWALLCGQTEALVGGLDETALQARVTGTCGADEVIRAINANGTVVCEVDDTGSGGVTSITAGSGLSATGTTSVTVDADLGAGLLATADSIALDFAGSTGIEPTASRSDHIHLYVPSGGTLDCAPGDLMFELDPSGSMFCNPDQDSQYSPGPSGNIQISGTEFRLSPTLFLTDLTASNYYYAAPGQTRFYSVHPAEFHHEGSGETLYRSDGTSGWLQCPAGTGCGSSVLAPLNLPHGAVPTRLEFFYRLADPGATIDCFLDEVELATGTYDSPEYIGQGATVGGILTVGSTPTLPAVDNDNIAQVAECFIDEPTDTPTMFLRGYRVAYTLEELVR